MNNKPQDRQDALEKLVPELDLCKQIPPGAFENSALVWSYSCDKRKTKPFIEERDCIDFCRRDMINAPPVYPAPTLQEILAEMPDSTLYYDGRGRWTIKVILPVCVYEDSNAKPANVALKLWLIQSGMSDQSDQSDGSDNDRKGGAQ